uniref:krev interaction trapped protein 1-like n=1 Tax=Styela clava TaxID=7725 RepID=UPI001939F2E2|nr:krev interaction trapped protein 1-like [Styela clava]
MTKLSDNVFIALLRPVTIAKPSSKTFKSKDYEIFMISSQEASDKESKRWTMPCLFIPVTHSKPQHIQRVIDHSFKVTKEASLTNTGVKVRRVIKAKKQKIQLKGSTQEITLFVVPTSAKHDPIPDMENPSLRPDGFRCLHETQREIHDHPQRYQDSTRQILEALDRWLKRQQSRPMALQALFRPSALDRIQENITNPAYVADESRDWRLLENKISPDQAMERMLKFNKCDIVVFNPMFGSEINPHNKVDLVIMNPFFGQGPPSYDQIKIPDREDWFKGRELSEENRELSWVDEFPLHRAAADGDLQTIDEILKTDSSRASNWDHDGWAPVHYACWYGRTDAFKLLVQKDDRCDPNLRNRNQTSLLHLAAGCGHPDIIKILLDHPFIDRHAVDKEGRTAQECCEQIRSRDWHKCSQLLKDGMNRPYQKLKIHKMDGSEKILELKHGSNTTMQDVLDLMGLPDDVTKCFTLWIASKSLHLQLKPEHRPLIEIKKWPNVLQRLSGVRSSELVKEVPKIYLRRDAKLLPSVEENVTDHMAILLLYEEAKVQFLQGMYPCSDEVAVAMAAITTRITYGPFDSKKHKIFTDTNMTKLLSPMRLRNKNVNWTQRIINEYKELTEQGPTEIHELQLLYMRYCWTQIPAYGCAYFTGYATATRQQGPDRLQRIVPLYIGVNYRGLFFIKVENRALLVYVSYHSLSWELVEEEEIFRISANNDKIAMIIHTPQAALVCTLMSKLSVGVG